MLTCMQLDLKMGGSGGDLTDSMCPLRHIKLFRYALGYGHTHGKRGNRVPGSLRASAPFVCAHASSMRKSIAVT